MSALNFWKGSNLIPRSSIFGSLDTGRNDPERMFEEMNRMMEPLRARETLASPACDVDESDSACVFSVDIPGLKKEDVNIETAGNQIVISGERKYEEENKSGTRRGGKFMKKILFLALCWLPMSGWSHVDQEHSHRHQYHHGNESTYHIDVNSHHSSLVVDEENEVELLLFKGKRLYKGDVEWEITNNRGLPDFFELVDHRGDHRGDSIEDSVAAIVGTPDFTGEICIEVTARSGDNFRRVTKKDVCLYVRCDDGNFWNSYNQRCETRCSVGKPTFNGRCVARASCPKYHKWDSRTGQCEHVRCESGEKWNHGKDRCVDRCDYDEKWSNKRSKCVDRCDRDEEWNSKKHRCQERCDYDEFWNKKTDRCEKKDSICKKGEFWNFKTKRCEDKDSFCKKGERWNPKKQRCDSNSRECRKGESWNSKKQRCEADKKECRKGESWNSKKQRCEADEKECRKGESWNSKKQRCEADEKECPKGESWNSKKQRCEAEKKECRKGFEWSKSAKKCVKKD